MTDLNSDNNFMLEGMWVLVSREEDVWVLEQLVPDEVAQSVVLLVDGED